MKIAFFIIFFLVSLNILSVDPSDIAIIIFTPILIFLNPNIVFLSKIERLCILSIFLFLASYCISMYFGFETRIVTSSAIGGLLFIWIYAMSLENIDEFPMGSIITISAVFWNLVFLIIGGFNIDLSDQLFDIFRDGRFLGQLGDPNFTGFYATFCAVFFTDKILYRSKTGSKYFFMYISLAVLSVVFILLTESRAAWAAALAALTIYVLTIREKQYKLIVPISLLGFVVLFVVAFGDKLSGGEAGNLSERAQSILVQSDEAEAERFKFVYTRASLNLGLESPLGVGPGKTAEMTGLLNVDGKPIGAHNAFVQIFTENGWGAFASMILLLLATVGRLWRRAVNGWMLNDIPCRVILAMVVAQVIFGFAHDMIAWRVGWVIPALSLCAAFGRARSRPLAPYKAELSEASGRFGVGPSLVKA